ncbi:MAG: hemerythrin domain-containing protein [Candidatus Eisenbacteria bacterium]|nr:hemerythrin domain-containing protein [Candidatus Eisenbacteria bacterium]
MARNDLFTTVHKGIRAALFDSVREAARADYRDSESTQRVVLAVRQLLELLEEHARAEDAVIFPEVEKLGPAVYADLHGDHLRIGGLQTEIGQLLDRVIASEGTERESLGARLHEKLGRLAAEHLLHMEREETVANRLLRAHKTDDELIAMRVTILRSIEPLALTRWAGALLPEISPVERAGFLAGLQKLLPAELYETIPASMREATFA